MFDITGAYHYTIKNVATNSMTVEKYDSKTGAYISSINLGVGNGTDYDEIHRGAMWYSNIVDSEEGMLHIALDRSSSSYTYRATYINLKTGNTTSVQFPNISFGLIPIEITGVVGYDDTDKCFYFLVTGSTSYIFRYRRLSSIIEYKALTLTIPSISKNIVQYNENAIVAFHTNNGYKYIMNLKNAYNNSTNWYIRSTSMALPSYRSFPISIILSGYMKFVILDNLIIDAITFNKVKYLSSNEKILYAAYTKDSVYTVNSDTAAYDYSGRLYHAYRDQAYAVLTTPTG